MRTIILRGLAIMGALATPAASWAATTPGSLNVTATVAAACIIGTPTDIAFGSVSQNTAVVNADGAIRFTCTNTTPWFVTVSTGSHPTGTTTIQNNMQNGSDNTQLLSYNLYSNTGRTTAFPTTVGTLGSGVTGGTGNGQVQTVNIYGQIPTGQVLPTPGSYSDIVAVTVNY